MKRVGLVGLDAKGLGALLAHEGDEEQAALFSAFSRELRLICKTEYHVLMQMAYIRDKLDKRDRELFEALGENP